MCRLIKRAVLAVLPLALCLLAACGGSTQDASAPNQETVLQDWLTSIYATDQGGRYTAFLEATPDGADAQALEDATDAYYQTFAVTTDPELLDTLTSNRIPMKYDEEYQEEPLTVDSVEFVQSENTGRYKYKVSAHNESGDLSFTGEIGWGESGLVDYFWES